MFCNLLPFLITDPHYITWSNNKYDFHGGCDQIAIDNCNIQVQTQTRPLTAGWSTVTEIAVLFKATGETFSYKFVPPKGYKATNKLTNASVSSVVPLKNGYQVNINDSNFIKVTGGGPYGIILEIQGGGGYMHGSVGMCGSWDNGFARYKDGTIFDTSTGFQGTRDKSGPLALDWQAPIDSSLLTDPSDICVADPSCGKGEIFDCIDGEDPIGPAVPGCEETNCDKVKPAERKEACENDIEITGDPTWACKYIDEDSVPIISPAPNQFVPTPTASPVPTPDLCDSNKPAQNDHPCGTDSCQHTCVIRPGEC